jgi:hypothetical protein
MDYTTSAIKGVSWLAAFIVVTRAISFGRTAVIVRTPNLVISR